MGIDISEHNINYATENYGNYNIKFLQGDIGESDFQILKGRFEKENINVGFDKVFSFNCLGWVKNSV